MPVEGEKGRKECDLLRNCYHGPLSLIYPLIAAILFSVGFDYSRLPDEEPGTQERQSDSAVLALNWSPDVSDFRAHASSQGGGISLPALFIPCMDATASLLLLGCLPSARSGSGFRG